MGFLRSAVYMAATGFGSFILGRILPKSIFHPEKFPYKLWNWEKEGKIYLKIGINKWQNKVPDMSKIFPNLMQEKKISHNFRDELPVMITETCVAELIHILLCFAGLAYIWLWPGIWGIVVSLLYILGNIPFVLIQRYNRPRLLRLQQKTAVPETGKEPLCLH